jgi:small-conductance mechanosensitive channel
VLTFRLHRYKRHLFLWLPLILLVCFGLKAVAQRGSADSQAIIGFLNQVVGWRRQVIASSQWSDQPGDIIFTADNETSANELSRLAFQYARAEAGLISPSTDKTGEDSVESSNFANLQKQTQDRIDAIQNEIKQVQSNAAKNAAQSQQRAAKLDELNSELALAQTRLNALKSFNGFIRQTTNQNKHGGGTLLEQIDNLARSVGISQSISRSSGPDATTQPGPPAPTASANNAVQANTATKQQASGIVGLIEESISLTRKLHNIAQLEKNTQALQSRLNQLRAPVRNDLVNTLNEAEKLQQAADSAVDPAILKQQAQQLDQATARFKLLSSATVPIGEGLFVLDNYLQHLQQWQAFVEQTRTTVLRRLAVQAIAVLIAIAVLLGVAEAWKRATFRYVRDVRRRSQFLLLRRVVMAIVITFVVAFALVTQSGSLATYVGLLTAGLAVALQNVILSVIAYFFLIGRYGLHAGDRVTIAGITGDVLEIGLVRLYLLELGGSANDMHPTGRSVVFSNSVILQPTTSVFKQMPGSDFIWHEVRLTLSPNNDFSRIEKHLLDAVREVFSSYKSSLRVHGLNSLDVGWSHPEPSSRLRFSDGGLEIVIRYPVLLSRAGEIDDKTTRTILHAIAAEPDVKLVPATAPNLQPSDGNVPRPVPAS